MSMFPDEILLTHPDGPGEVRITLPMNMELVGNALMKLGELGFVLPEAIGKGKMIVEFNATSSNGVDAS